MAAMWERKMSAKVNVVASTSHLEVLFGDTLADRRWALPLRAAAIYARGPHLPASRVHNFLANHHLHSYTSPSFPPTTSKTAPHHSQTTHTIAHVNRQHGTAKPDVLRALPQHFVRLPLPLMRRCLLTSLLQGRHCSRGHSRRPHQLPPHRASACHEDYGHLR